MRSPTSVAEIALQAKDALLRVLTEEVHDKQVELEASTRQLEVRFVPRSISYGSFYLVMHSSRPQFFVALSTILLIVTT